MVTARHLQNIQFHNIFILFIDLQICLLSYLLIYNKIC